MLFRVSTGRAVTPACPPIPPGAVPLPRLLAIPCPPASLFSYSLRKHATSRLHRPPVTSQFVCQAHAMTIEVVLAVQLSLSLIQPLY